MSWCERKLKELNEIKKERSLTEDEYETYCYCKSQIEIAEWEEDNYNMIILY